MLALKIIDMLLGLAFALFGYFIFFQRRYDLINGFEADFKAGRRDEKYARRVGLIELVLGVILLTAGVLLIIVT